VRAQRLVWLIVVLGVALLPGVGRAQERQRVTVEAGSPVTVYADRVENLDRDRLLIAEGNVQLEQGDVRLEADRMEVNTETGEAVASGRAVLFDGRDRLTGSRIEYNLRSGTGIVYQAEAAAEPHFFFGGNSMERFGDKAYRIQSGVFTTCEDESPAWSVRLGKATAYLDDWMWGTNASFWVWKAPLVPFIPFFATSLRKDRHSGLLTPTFGSSNEKGFFVRQPIYIVLGDSQDLMLAPAYFSKRGPGIGATYRYVRREGSRGELDGFYVHDKVESSDHGENRGVASLRHQEDFTPRLVLKADVARVSDDEFLSEFGNTLDQRGTQRLESNVSVSQRWEKWNFVGRFFFYQDLTTGLATELQRLPQLTLSAFQQPIFGPTGAADPELVGVREGLLFEMESSYNNFVREVGSAGQRFDLFPRLSYPFSPGGFFTITPRVGVRETIYDAQVTGTKEDQGLTVEDTDKTFTNRTLFQAGADFEARAYRVFELGGAMGIEKMQHVIEPRVSYNFLDGDDSKELPQWDGIDNIPTGSTVTYSLTNRLKARAVGEDERPGRVWEVIRFTLSQAYAIEPDPDVQRLSNVAADLIVEPYYGVRFRGTAAFDPYEWTVAAATTDFSYEAARWRAAIGTRHADDGKLAFIQGSIEARLGARWTVRFSSDYNVDIATVIENRLEIEFREQCWAISAAFIDRVDEDEFRITVNLLELGQYGFGRGFTSFQ
jgi:LPS-assembly protein